METLEPSPQPERDGPDTWVITKPCLPWSDRDGQGRPLLWDALHPKARDFLVTEATFQTLANDRGYADYGRAMVAGNALGAWHDSSAWRAKLVEAKSPGARVFSPRELAAARMITLMIATVGQANGRLVARAMKGQGTGAAVAPRMGKADAAADGRAGGSLRPDRPAARL